MMRKFWLLFLLSLLLGAQQVWAAIAKVAAQPAGVTHTSSSSTTCANVATTGFGVAGDTFFISVALQAGSAAPTVADNASGGSNSYTCSQINNTNGSNQTLCWNTTTRGNTGALVITATFSGQRNSCTFAEYSGVVSIGTPQSNTGGSNTTPTETNPTTNGNSWLVAGMSNSNGTGTWSAATGTLETSVAGGGTTTPGDAIVDSGNVVTSGTSTTTSATMSAAKFWSVVQVELYSTTPTVSAPTASPAGGSYTATQAAPTLTSTTSGAVICYLQCTTAACSAGTPAATTPGTCSTGTQIASGAAVATAINNSGQITSLATKAGWTNSSVTTSTYTLTLPTPAFSPNGGSFNNDTSTSFSSTGAAHFCSTLDGTTPTSASDGTCSNGTLGSSNTVVATGTAVKAIATAANWTNSAVGTSSSFTLTVGAVSCTPGTGTYTSTQSVTCSVATTTGSTILYCLDGVNTCTPSTTYTGAISISSSTYLRVQGTKTNYVSDSVVSYQYTINVQVWSKWNGVAVGSGGGGSTVYFGGVTSTAGAPLTGGNDSGDNYDVDIDTTSAGASYNTCPGSGTQTVVEMGLYAAAVSAGVPNTLRLAIYGPVDGTHDNTLIMQTGSLNVSDTTMQWRTFTTFYDSSLSVISNPTLTGGTKYHLILGVSAVTTGLMEWQYGAVGSTTSSYLSSSTHATNGFPATEPALSSGTNAYTPAIRVGVGSISMSKWNNTTIGTSTSNIGKWNTLTSP